MAEMIRLRWISSIAPARGNYLCLLVVAVLLALTISCVRDSGQSCGAGQVKKDGQCVPQHVGGAPPPPAGVPVPNNLTGPQMLTPVGQSLTVQTDVTGLKSVLKPGESYDKVAFEFTGGWLIEGGKVQTEAIVTGTVGAGNADIKRCAARNASKIFNNVRIGVVGDDLSLTFPGGALSAADKEAIKAVLDVFGRYGKAQVNETFQDRDTPPASFTTSGGKCFDLIYRAQTYGFSGAIPAGAQISPSDDLGAVPTLSIFVRTNELKSVKVASLTGSGLKYFLINVDPAFSEYFRVDANPSPFKAAMKRLVLKAALAVR